ncbi:hypothetical protein [Aquimarina sp. AD10]|uniref:hypothetical protein n=1 Tax=Aquimarina sp. AD10 TaxID=1714849 RepID=UPI0011C37116|nr:hypothetical protein [Aquimarina sp. AD10]
MNKIFYIAFSGLIMLASGIFLFLSSKIGVEIIKILVPLLLLLSGISAIVFSKYEKIPRIAQQYHIIQGVGLVAYAIILFFLANSLPSFLMITTYFVIMYGLFEIIFIFGVLNAKHTINKSILMSRAIAGGLNLVGGFFLLLASLNDEIQGLSIAALLISIGGLSIAIFAHKLSVKDIL